MKHKLLLMLLALVSLLPLPALAGNVFEYFDGSKLIHVGSSSISCTGGDLKATQKMLKDKGYKVKKGRDDKYLWVRDKAGKYGLYSCAGEQLLACVLNEIPDYWTPSEMVIGDRRFIEIGYNYYTPDGRLLDQCCGYFGLAFVDASGAIHGLVKRDEAYGIASFDDNTLKVPHKYTQYHIFTLGDRSFVNLYDGNGSCLYDFSFDRELLGGSGYNMFNSDVFPIDTEAGKRFVLCGHKGESSSSMRGACVVDQDMNVLLPWGKHEITVCKQSYRTLFVAQKKTGYTGHVGDIFKKWELGFTGGPTDLRVYDAYGTKLYSDEIMRGFTTSLYQLPNDWFVSQNKKGSVNECVLLDNNFQKVKDLGRASTYDIGNNVCYLRVFNSGGNYEPYGYTFRGDKIKIAREPDRVNRRGDFVASGADLALAKKHAKPSSQNTLIAGSKAVTKELPSLEIVPGSLRFVDATGRNAIEAGGQYTVEFTVANKGKGTGRRCRPVIGVKGTDIKIAAPAEFDIAPGTSTTLRATVNAGQNTTEGMAEFSVAVDEANGFGTDKQLLTVNTHAFEAPMLVVNDYTLTGNGQTTTLQKKVPFDLQVLVQNIEHGSADDVSIALTLPDNVFVVEGEVDTRLGHMNGGEVKSLVYTLVANNRYTASTIPVTISLREKHGRYAKDRTISLALEQPLAASKIAVDEHARKRADINIATLTSDVDRDIPSGKRNSPNTFAVIISNENYSEVASVPHALNDGQIFAQYCRSTLGIPADNIRHVANATRNDMSRQLNWLREIGQAYGSDASIIFYYSGHGVPSEADKTSYLMPVDGYHSDMSTNIALDDVYATLGNTGAANVTVFLDACFSGSERGDNMLVAARGVRLKARNGAPKGRMVVFSASQGDETAYPLEDERHGMFTYYLLKKLKESAGDVTLGELGDFLTSEVRRKSVVVNSKPQTPAVLASPVIADSWRQLKL